jgi:membrane-associated phospholipid phosphatase
LVIASLTIGGVYVGSMLLARALGRRRPCHRRSVSSLVECPDGPALPSDQTAAAFAGAVFLADAAPKLAVPIFAAAGLVGVARVYCGVHWPSDVVAGGAVGGAVAAVVRRWSESRRRG